MIDFELTEEQLLLEQTVREWGARDIAPKIHDLDRAHRFDPDILPQMASLGLLGLCIPTAYGGRRHGTSVSGSLARSWSMSIHRAA